MSMSTNFGAAANDYATFRAGFPESLFDRLAALGIGVAGQRIVDVGTGTGALARGFARRGATVLAIDPDNRMLDEARRLDADAGVTVEYRLGTAEQLPIDDAIADVTAAGQCWHWFDGARAAHEFARVTKARGRVLVAHFDWLPIRGSVVEATEGLIVKHNPSWAHAGGNGIHVQSLAALGEAGFRLQEIIGYDLDVPYTPEAWRGRIRASSGVAASLTPDRVRAFDADHQTMLAAWFPEDVIPVPHRIFAVVAERRVLR